MDNESWLFVKELDDMIILLILNFLREKYVLRNVKIQDFIVVFLIFKNFVIGDYDRKSLGMEISYGN